MKIVVLDGYGLNPGDLSWEGFRVFCELAIYDRTSPDEVLERSAGAGILLTNKTILNKATLGSLPDLKYVGVLATGYNVIDIDAARELGIVVTNIPSYSTNSVAQMTFAFILELCHHVQNHSDSVMQGKWSLSKDFTYRDYPLTELFSKTIGLIGFGSIGSKVGDIATAFGMNIIASGRTQSDQSHRKNFRWAGLTELLQESDFVSIHCPLTPETSGLINAGSLRLMKKTTFLINTSRGPIVVDKDLADALNEGIIAGAALDVLTQEPPPADNPLFVARNCIITPHIAWATIEARTRLMEIAANNVKAFLSGKPVNVVSG